MYREVRLASAAFASDQSNPRSSTHNERLYERTNNNHGLKKKDDAHC